MFSCSRANVSAAGSSAMTSAPSSAAQTVQVHPDAGPVAEAGDRPAPQQPGRRLIMSHPQQGSIPLARIRRMLPDVLYDLLRRAKLSYHGTATYQQMAAAGEWGKGSVKTLLVAQKRNFTFFPVAFFRSGPWPPRPVRRRAPACAGKGRPPGRAGPPPGRARGGGGSTTPAAPGPDPARG